jgi:uncharacterized protein YoxC
MDFKSLKYLLTFKQLSMSSALFVFFLMACVVYIIYITYVVYSGFIIQTKKSMSEPMIEIEPMTDNNTNKCCDNSIDTDTVTTIDENTKNINDLRTLIQNINTDALLGINKRIQTLNESIENNVSDLKDITQQKMDNINSTLGLNIQSDGSVYDLNGKPIYEEK